MCDAAFVQAYSWKKRIVSAHTNREKELKCSSCNYVTFFKYRLTKHLMVHIKEKPHKCNDCGHSFKYLSNLRRHEHGHKFTNQTEQDLTENCGKEVHTCETCNAAFALPSSLQIHLIKAHNRGKTPHKCDYCGRSFRHIGYLKRHELGHKAKNHLKQQDVTQNDGGGSHKCKKCNAGFAQQSNLNEHMLLEHGIRKKELKCSMCNYVTCYEYNLSRHLDVHTKGKPHKCNDCGCSFRHIGNLKRHKLGHKVQNHLKQQDVTQNDGGELHKCKRCNAAFAQPSNLQEHMVLEHGIRKQEFKCSLCPYVTVFEHNLTRHLIVHTRRKRHECNDCGRLFRRLGNLQRHELCHKENNQGREKPHKCQECDASFVQITNLKKHILAAHKKGEETFKCSSCDYVTVYKHCLTRHVMIHMGGKPHKCKDCGLQFRHINNLKRHTRKHEFGYKGIKPHTCVICNRAFYDEKSLRKHKLKVHRRVTLFKCARCRYTTLKRSYLRRHNKAVHLFEDPKFKCNKCDYQCNEKRLMMRHQFIHGEEKSYKCNNCEDIIVGLGNLLKHSKSVHNEGKLFKCTSCDYVSPFQKVLKDHLLVHSQENPFKCNDCNYGFNARDDLRRHQLLVHKGKKELKCSLCDFVALDEDILKEHLLTHNQIELKCSLCDFVTLNKDTLKEHLLTHKEETVYKCDNCEYLTSSSLDLQNHSLQHQRNETINSDNTQPRRCQTPEPNSKPLWRPFED